MARADRLKLRPQKELRIALDDLDLSFFPEEVERAKKLWNFGWHISDIAKQVHRDPDELAALIMDMARKGEIQRRRGGVFGDEICC